MIKICPNTQIRGKGMKKALIRLCIIGLLKTLPCSADNNPLLSLNPQDVPIFYENNPLSGLKSFTIINSIASKELQAKIKKSVEKSLEMAGKVTRLKDNDMRGFGSGNILLIQMGNVQQWDGTETAISRLSLSIETPVTLEKTGTKTFPIIWSINTFVQDSINTGSEEALTQAVEKLIDNFIQNYQYANQKEMKKPVFYTYD